jgi:iron complex outermembrane receptor protein
MNRRSSLRAAVAAACAASATVANAQVEEVVVTATKREASTQDIAVAVQALGETALEDLGIGNFEDYLIQLPGVTAGGSGPGQNTIYIRGLASTTPNLTTAGVAGLAPNVAFYLDEQPLAQPGRNLDVYVADINRVEVLSGPQGTLFGASSQAGTVRLITNKPDPIDTYGDVKLGTAFTQGGEASANVEAMLNLPVNDRFTLRGVVYVDNQGGYIDNVAGTRSVAESARFRPAGTVRDNGVPVSDQRAGFQADADLSDVNFLTLDNSTRTEENFNETTYTGGRLSGLIDINDDWSLLLSYMHQQLDSEGVFFADPDLGDYEIQRFANDTLEDSFNNFSWTLDGRISALEVLYTGAYTDRDTDQVVDYTDYLFVGQYLPYYICDGSVSYPGSADPSGTCQPPSLFVTSRTETKVMTHEVRVNTPAEKAVRATVGAFYSDLQLDERNDFTYPGSVIAQPFGPFAPNFPFMTGFTSDDGPFPDGVIFRNDVRRTDEQFGLFGEVTWDMTERFALTLGARYYDISVGFDGSANASFCNSGAAEDLNGFGTDIADLYNGDGQVVYNLTCNPDAQITVTPDTQLEDTSQAFRDQFDSAEAAEAALDRFRTAAAAPSKASTNGVIGKATLAFAPTDNALVFATWSQGFRPGLLNRPGGATGPSGFTVPFALDTDDVTNYELGWKLDLANRTFRLNGSVFYVDIERLQTTIFDPSITNLFFSDNAANAEIMGLEGDFIWTPGMLDGLTLSGGFSFLNTEITDVLTPTDDVRVGDELAFAPDFQGTLRARYEWDVGSGLTAHVMPTLSYSSGAFSDIITINRDEMDSWMLAGITAGVRADQWAAELFVDNIFNEQAELARSFVYDRQRVTYARPLTAGLRVSFGF